MVKDINGAKRFVAKPNTGGVLMSQKTCQSIPSLILLTVLIFSPLNTSGQQLRLDISLSDTIYYVCQPIWLDAQLTNISADTVRVQTFKFPGGGILNAILTNESGDTLRTVWHAQFLDWSGFILNPKEWYYEAFDLADIFHNYEVVPEFPTFQWRTASLAPGRYEVSAEYHFRQNRVGAPKITFEVIEPTSAEREAFELYVEAYKNQNRKNYSLAKQQLNKLITGYSKSVYAEKAYWWLHRDEELLEKCPDSGYLTGHLRTKIDKMSKEEKEEFLQKVIKEHPGTRSAKFAEQLLRGW